MNDKEQEAKPNTEEAKDSPEKGKEKGKNPHGNGSHGNDYYWRDQASPDSGISQDQAPTI